MTWIRIPRSPTAGAAPFVVQAGPQLYRTLKICPGSFRIGSCFILTESSILDFCCEVLVRIPGSTSPVMTHYSWFSLLSRIASESGFFSFLHDPFQFIFNKPSHGLTLLYITLYNSCATVCVYKVLQSQCMEQIVLNFN